MAQSNPLARSSLDTRDFRNALADIRSDIERGFELIDAHEKSGTTHSEIPMVLHLSGLEIKMTNFADMMRKKFA